MRRPAWEGSAPDLTWWISRGLLTRPASIRHAAGIIVFPEPGLLPRLGLGVLLAGGLVELLALGVGQDVAVALQELQMHPRPGPVGTPGRVEESVTDGEGPGRGLAGPPPPAPGRRRTREPRGRRRRR